MRRITSLILAAGFTLLLAAGAMAWGGYGMGGGWGGGMMGSGYHMYQGNGYGPGYQGQAYQGQGYGPGNCPAWGNYQGNGRGQNYGPGQGYAPNQNYGRGYQQAPATPPAGDNLER